MTKSKASLAKTHASYSPDWWTPRPWKDWAAKTLDPAELYDDDVFDPCPGTWKPTDASGLEIDWGRRVYVNHPGSRDGSAQRWWTKAMDEQDRQNGRMALVWCAFNVEQLRHLSPSPFHLPGTLVMPRARTAFIWGGPDIAEKRDGKGKVRKAARVHGQPMKSPGNWTVFWTTEEIPTPPVRSIIVRTC